MSVKRIGPVYGADASFMREPRQQQLLQHDQLAFGHVDFLRHVDQAHRVTGDRRQHDVEGAGEHGRLGDVVAQGTVPPAPFAQPVEPLVQNADHLQIGLPLCFGARFMLQIAVEIVVEPQDIPVVPVQVQEGIQVEAQVLGAGHAFMGLQRHKGVVVRNVFVPLPGADGDDQIQL